MTWGAGLKHCGSAWPKASRGTPKCARVLRAIAISLVPLGSACTKNPAARPVRLAEPQVRALATFTPTPVYPTASLADRIEGVAVASVRVNEDGIVTSTSVLEAPSPELAHSVSEAVSLWRFSGVLRGGTPTSFEGVLVFYFRVRDGRPVVLNPVEAAADVTPPATSPR